MILKMSQRGSARGLANHLMNLSDNDHVTLHELRGFLSKDVHGAFDEIDAISQGTKCKQPMVSLSINPPPKQHADLDSLIEAADKAELALGLLGQPRAIIVHEKNGRRHIHTVWSRIQADKMKAVHLPHFKLKMAKLSKELYLEHGWELPNGHKTNGWKNPLNFTLAEWQQAKRIDLDPREIKQIFISAWERSDNRNSFGYALAEHGLFLARGDRRGFVAVDLHGEVYSVSRWTGVRTKALKQKLGIPDGLPKVDSVKAEIKAHLTETIRGFLKDSNARQKKDLVPLLAERAHMIHGHRKERVDLTDKQRERHNQETRSRNQRLRHGLAGLWDTVTGKARAIKRQNEREAYKSLQRDKQQREHLFVEQTKERKELHRRMKLVRDKHEEERKQLRRHVVSLLRRQDQHSDRTHQPTNNPTLER